MNPTKRLAWAAALLLAAGGAQAQAPASSDKAYRCVDEKGRTLYTDRGDPRCKAVRIDPAPGAPKPAAKAAPPPKPRPVARTAPEPRSRKTHCAALEKGAAEFAKGKSGGLDRKAAAHRQAGLSKDIAKGCSDPSAPLDD